MTESSRHDELAAALGSVRARIARAEEAAGRESGDVRLLVVTKFHPASDLVALIGLGEREFGESREPEAGRKVEQVRGECPDTDFSVDMIGSVQRKKAKTVARWARRVHSVDSPELVDALASGAQKAIDAGERTGPLGVLLQMSLDGDIHRGGAVEAELPVLADRVLANPETLTLDGLMVITPLDGDADAHLADASRIRDGFLARYPGATEFSAGMSGDLESAIAHGSTCVRVGTAIVGPRPIISP